MPVYKISHITKYTYASPVIDCTNQIMLYPIMDDHLTVQKHEVSVSHNPEIEIYHDYFGNKVGVFSIIKPHTELVIQSSAQVITNTVVGPMDEMPAEDQWQYLRDLKNNFLFIDFLKQESYASSENVKASLDNIVNLEEKPLKNALILSEFVYDNFSYKKGITNIETPIEDVWKLKAGVCQDFAHILLAILRIYGIPARYVSGYICPKETGVRGEGATHAWVEAYIPFYGWLGLDPTNNCIVTDGHVKMAIGRSFSDCTPVKGTYKGSGEHILEVKVQVENGKPKPAATNMEASNFTYIIKNKQKQTNSYRNYLEMQQQQQQQQQ